MQQRLVCMYAPKTASSSFPAQFVTACQQRNRVMGLPEMLDYACPEERRQTVAALMADGSVAFWESVVAENRKETGFLHPLQRPVCRLPNVV